MLKATVWNGKKITKPGVYSHVPIASYHSQTILDGPSVSSSQLRRVLEENGGSPAHMFCEWSGNPDCAEEEATKALILGRATHHLLLGQGAFSEEFVIRPETVPDQHGVLVAWQSNKTCCREWVARAERGGFRWNAERSEWIPDPKQKPLTILTGTDIEDIRGMALALGNHPIVREGILSGQPERSFFYKDKPTGLWIKVRPDNVPTDSGDYSDLKTTTSVQWRDLVNTMGAYAYHQSAALVADAGKECAGIEFHSFNFVFVEKKPPYCSRVVQVEPEDIALGRKQNRRALDIIARCLEAKHWPGPGEDMVHVIRVSEGYRGVAERNTGEHERDRDQRRSA